MVEHINDLMSLVVIGVILLIIGKYALDEFLKSYAKYFKQLEDDYYNDFEDND